MPCDDIAHDLTPRGGLAHVIGAPEPELWHRTIPEVFEATVTAHPEREAAVFVEQGVRWTWAELDREVSALAAGLHELAIMP